MHILLTGASGFVGRHILKALLDAGHQIHAAVHRHQLPSGITTIHLDLMAMNTPEHWLEIFKKVEPLDAVINCVGIIAENSRQTFEGLHVRAAASLFRACVKAGISRVIHLSALGADETAKVPYHLSKKVADEVLQSLPLDWFILQPSLIFGDGSKSFRLFQQLSNLPLIPLIGDGCQRIQPVHIHDLVATVLVCLDQDVAAKQLIPVVGEQPITYKNCMIQLRSKKSRARFLPLPMDILMPLSRLGKLVGLPMINADSLLMLQQHNVADSARLREFLGRPLSRIFTVAGDRQ